MWTHFCLQESINDLTHKNGGHFQYKGHFYRHASNEQNVNIPLLINFNRSVMFFKIIYKCLFVYNVYFLCRHMKFNLVRHMSENQNDRI